MTDDDHTPALGGAHGACGEGALRGLLRGAVEGLEPADGALERLRYAVPARRARRRQIRVGAVAAALLAGAAIPAALHLSAPEEPGTGHSAMAGHGQDQGKRGGAPSDPHQNGHGAQPRSSRSSGASPGAAATAGQQSPPAAGAPSGGATQGATSGAEATAGSTGSTSGPLAGGGPQPPAAAGLWLPGCGAEQLDTVGSVRPAGADGTVYGSFRVANVSGRGCTLSGPDSVTASGAAAPVAVVAHSAGDPASGLLPDPGSEAPGLALQPNAAYEVRFAWVPGEPCPAPTPATDGGAGGTPPQEGTDAGAAGAPAAQAQPAPEPEKPAGVAVSHTPATGTPTTTTTIPEACGGTLYRTGPIPVASATP